MKKPAKPNPQAPRHLRAATREWWESVTTGYELEPHHVRLLTLAAEAWDRCTEARETLGREGLTFKDRFGKPATRPEVGIERDSRIAFARLLRELALDVSEPEGPVRSPPIHGKAGLRR